MKTSAVILAGGSGRRMGRRNKALLTYGSDTFFERQIRICASWSDEIVVVSNDAAALNGIRMGHAEVKIVPDQFPHEGPLAGLQAGFAAAAHRYVWLLACDQPLVSAAAATLLLERLSRENATSAALPVLGGRPQPLHAVYRRQEVAAAAETLLQNGERKLRALLDLVRWVAIDEEAFNRHDIPTNFADDVDTPEDYDSILGSHGCNV